jgi:hypothetical protein
MIVFLLLASGGTYFAYEKYFKPIQSEFAKNQEKAAQMQSKIQSLETTFGKTKPPIVIEALNKKKQPWLTRSRQFLSYYETEEIEKTSMPDDVIPSFWYQEKYPEIDNGLYQFARERGVHLAAINFGINPPQYYSGGNPSRKDILREVNKFNQGIALTKYILDAKPKFLEYVSIWPERVVRDSKSGEIIMQTTGYKMTINNEDLIRFLERLNNEDKYVNVNGIKIINRQLRNKNNPYEVELLISTARIRRAEEKEDES